MRDRRPDRLSGRERQDLLAVLDNLRTAPRSRPARAVDDEIAALRRARRSGRRVRPTSAKSRV